MEQRLVQGEEEHGRGHEDERQGDVGALQERAEHVPEEKENDRGRKTEHEREPQS